MDVREDSIRAHDSRDCRARHAASSDDESVEPCTVERLLGRAAADGRPRVLLLPLAFLRALRRPDAHDRRARPARPAALGRAARSAESRRVPSDDRRSRSSRTASRRGGADAQSALDDHYMRWRGRADRDDARARRCTSRPPAEGSRAILAKVAYMQPVLGAAASWGPDYVDRGRALHARRAPRLPRRAVQPRLPRRAGRGHAPTRPRPRGCAARAAAPGHVNAQLRSLIATSAAHGSVDAGRRRARARMRARGRGRLRARARGARRRQLRRQGRGGRRRGLAVAPLQDRACRRLHARGLRRGGVHTALRLLCARAASARRSSSSARAAPSARPSRTRLPRVVELAEPRVPGLRR